jgi:hypothetical protein
MFRGEKSVFKLSWTHVVKNKILEKLSETSEQYIYIYSQTIIA